MMRFTCLLAVVVAAGWLCGCQSVKVPQPSASSPEAEAAMKKTCQFLKEAKFYCLATVDGDQARVRPFGTVHIFEGKLYIQTGRRKNVAKQLLANGKVELCAVRDREWIRVTGTLVEDPRREARVSMLEAYPGLKKMYSPDDGNTMVLYFQPGTVTAVFSAYSPKSVTVKF